MTRSFGEKQNRKGGLPGASTGDPTHDKVMWKSLTGQGGSGLKGSSARASTPKPESVCFTISCLSLTPLTLMGGCPRPPFSEENQLRVWLISLLGIIRVFQSKNPSDGFLACLTSLSRLLQLRM